MPRDDDFSALLGALSAAVLMIGAQAQTSYWPRTVGTIMLSDLRIRVFDEARFLVRVPASTISLSVAAVSFRPKPH